MKETIKMDRIEDAIADFKEGKFVIVVDDEDRENEGDLIIAAEKADFYILFTFDCSRISGC